MSNSFFIVSFAHLYPIEHRFLDKELSYSSFGFAALAPFGE